MKRLLVCLCLIAFPAFAQYSHRSNPGTATGVQPTITTTFTGACPGTGCVTLNTQSTTTMIATIAGTWVATLQFNCSNDGWATFSNISADSLTAGSLNGSPTTSVGVNGTYIMPTFGFKECGVLATSFTSNTSMTIRLDADPSPSVPIGATGAGALQIEGNTADGAAAVGNPLVTGLGFNKIALAPRYCDRTVAVVNLGTTATLQQITGVAAQNIYICGYQILASTATAGINLNWTEGTGANCGTGTLSVGGAFTTTTTTPPTAPLSFGPTNPGIRMTSAAGNSLCLTQSAVTNATTSSGIIWYTVN